MLVWCSFCQRFLHEKPPYESLEVSHGMCEACAVENEADAGAHFERIQAIAAFQRRVWAAGREGRRETAPELVQESRALGVRPVDLALGLLAPLLEQVGREWQTGGMSVAEEHAFTAFVESVLQALLEQGPELRAFINAPRPQMLIGNVAENQHALGVRLLELWLADHGIASRTVFPGLPPEHWASLVRQTPGVCVGLSVSMAEQQPAVERTLAALAALPEPPAGVLLGGYAVKAEGLVLAEQPGVRFVRQLHELEPLLPAGDGARATAGG